MSLVTRQPTGKPPWPILLIAGMEKAGKSWACAQASASDLIGRTLWIGIGEDQPDEYGSVPGARFEIVEHDGTYRGILGAVRDAAAEPATNGKPNLIVLDSGTRLWHLLSDMAQAEANRRDRIKAEKYKRRPAEEDVQITPDLWNQATGRWTDVLDVLRAHQGPAIITARLDLVMVMGADGKPTSEKHWKVQAQKHLPYDVGAVVEMPTRGEAYLTGVRSVKLADQSQARRELRGFTVDRLWRDLGMADGQVGQREFTTSSGAASVEAEDRATARDGLLARLREAVTDPRPIAAQWQKEHGHPIRDTTDLDSLTALVVLHEAQVAA